MVVVNLESGMPGVETAMIQLRQSLLTAKSRRTKVIKLIHGYGSSGRGGVIRTAVRSELARRKQSGQIKEYVTGEEFSPFYENARLAVEAEPELRKDLDYARTNQGITIVVL
ncbi:MAG: Smr/MutS family protein [Angelakisella sp.]